MARRKQKHLIRAQIAFGLLVVIGIIFWILAEALQNAPSGSGNAIGLVVLIIVVGIITFPIVRLIRRATARNALLEKVRAATDQQLEPLLRRRAQLVRLDPYGKPQHDKWAKEINYFIAQHIQPALTASEKASLARNHTEVFQLIDQRVVTAQREQPGFQTFSDDMTPAEFETFCAEELRRAGWDARVTMQSRDQGADVIAEKGGRRVVLRCKLSARSVGNRAVQEVTAAKNHEQADFGIVVSNNRYTEPAEQLAATNRVLLIHYRDLQNLDDILDRQRTV
ncbi:MAG: restriction endonuclease [Acidobacteriia bacterium]|nr:restriction endonuclease [Methyloceanibacter sp.]MCL6492027.1 restriction endonuclease [Terriglobia bacterium]